jgi:hypothetical protein
MRTRTAFTPSRWRLALAFAVAFAAGLGTWLAPLGSSRAVAAAPAEFYGVATLTAMGQNDFNRLARANIRTVRIPMYWPALATGPGRYNWLNYDGTVIHAVKAGVRIIPTFLGSPKFVSGEPMRPPLDSATDRALWHDFVRSAVERYGPGGEFWDFVRACPPHPGHCRPDIPYRPFVVWQGWNEPNHEPFWRPTPSPGEYADLLAITNDAVKSVDPGAELITGGIAPGGRGAIGSIPQNDFIAAMYQRGAAGSFDGLDLHPYSRKPKQARGLVQDARAVTQAYGDGQTPLWITEIGWSTKGPKDSDQVTSRKGQGKRLAKVMKMFTSLRNSLGIKLASWFAYKDAATSLCVWCHGTGLFDNEDRPKPAWRKYVGVTGGQQ